MRAVRGLVLLVVLLAVPTLVPARYWMRMLDVACIYVVLTLSYNILYGFAGQLSFGHAGFYAIGAYASAIITMRGGLPYLVAFMIAGLLSAVAGFILGLPTLRVKGRYLGLVTVGFGHIVRLVAFNWRSLTGGQDGITLIPPISFGPLVLDSDHRVYYFFLLVIAAAAFVSYRIKDSKYGRALLSVRDDELAAEVLGMNATSLKVQAFVLSAFFAGLAGSLYAHLVSYICPEVFGFSVSLAVPTMMVFGGIGSIPGSALGAVALTVLPELLRVGKQYYMLLYGIGLFVMLIFKPTGIAGLAEEVAVRLKALRGRQSSEASVLRVQETPTGRSDVESTEC